MFGRVLRATAGWVAIFVAPSAPSLASQAPAAEPGRAALAGAALYAARCADCHGADATGVRGPDLTRLWGTGATDERVFQTIRQGVPGSIMPARPPPTARCGRSWPT